MAGFKPADFNKCSQKAKCCGGEQEGDVFEVDDPCEEGCEFDRQCCRCICPNVQTWEPNEIGGAGRDPGSSCGAPYGDGWFSRQNREIVIVKDGAELYRGPSKTSHTVGNYIYRPTNPTFDMNYGWWSGEGIKCEPQDPPNGDSGIAYTLRRELRPGLDTSNVPGGCGEVVRITGVRNESLS